MQTLTASIEIENGQRKLHGFCPDTPEPLARRCVEDIYQNRVASKLPIVTVALMRNGKIVAVFYGDHWNSDDEH